MIPRAYLDPRPSHGGPGDLLPSTEALFQSTSGTLVGVDGRSRRRDTNPNISRHVNVNQDFSASVQKISPTPTPTLRLKPPETQLSETSHHSNRNQCLHCTVHPSPPPSAP